MPGIGWGPEPCAADAEGADAEGADAEGADFDGADADGADFDDERDFSLRLFVDLLFDEEEDDDELDRDSRTDGAVVGVAAMGAWTGTDCGVAFGGRRVDTLSAYGFIWWSERSVRSRGGSGRGTAGSGAADCCTYGWRRVPGRCVGASLLASE